MTTSDVELGPGYLVKRVQQGLRRRSDHALRPLGLSMAQYAVLRALADHPEASASDLARLCFVTRQSLRDVLHGLRHADFVEDAGAQQGGRRTSLQLTTLGANVLKVGHAAVLDVESAMLQGISTAARSELGALLTRCADNLDAVTED